MYEKRDLGVFLEGITRVAIAGHVNPDGDCIGSCMGTWLYLKDNFPDVCADVYLEKGRDVFGYISGLEQARDTLDPEAEYDLLILLDVSSHERIGVAGPLLDRTEKTLCFDHHVTNKGGYTWFFNRPEASSASEVVFGFMQEDLVSRECAAAIYTGIAHDTGIFQYSCTSPETMRIAARLMEKGIPFSRIIDESYYQKSYGQNRACGFVMENSELYYGGQLIMGSLSGEEMLRFGVIPKDMDGIVETLRNTIGVKASAFLYEKEPGSWKVSFRSKDSVDVSALAQRFGGGGHVRAAGCSLEGDREEAVRIVKESFSGIFQQDCDGGAG